MSDYHGEGTGKSMANKKKKKKKIRREPWELPVKLATVAVTLAAICLVGSTLVQKYVFFSGIKPVLLTGSEVDFRDARMSVEEYEQLKDRMPDTVILWSVPVGGAYYESEAEHIILEKLFEEDLPAFSYFRNLKSVNALKCNNHAALVKLEEMLPGVEIEWQVHIGGQSFHRDAELVDLEESGVTMEDLNHTLGYFSEGTTVKLGDTGFSEEDLNTLKEQYPKLGFRWGVNLMGEIYPSSEKKLSFAGQSVDVQALIDAGSQFRAMEEIDLRGCGLTLEELSAIYDAFGGTRILAEFSLHGVNVTTEDTKIDLNGIKLSDTLAVEQAVKLMPNLVKVDMSNCGFTDEQMDALNKKYENIQFVWVVRFSVYELRTDAKAFCASNLPQRGYIAMKLRSEDLEPLKYCTELIALDLGSMYYDDLSFLENLHKLQYLILVDARYSDISILAQMKELYYLELFKNQIDDISPLLECKNLRHLNIGYTSGFDTSPLKEMTWLERLWYPGHELSKEEEQAIKDALLNTQVYMPEWDPNGSTGGKWREADVYYEMRNLFKMFYQPGGTGTKKE